MIVVSVIIITFSCFQIYKVYFAEDLSTTEDLTWEELVIKEHTNWQNNKYGIIIGDTDDIIIYGNTAYDCSSISITDKNAPRPELGD